MLNIAQQEAIKVGEEFIQRIAKDGHIEHATIEASEESFVIQVKPLNGTIGKLKAKLVIEMAMALMEQRFAELAERGEI